MAAEASERPETAGLMPISEIIGSPIVERRGDRIARVKDLVARMQEGLYPQLTGIVSRAGGREFFIPMARVAELRPGRVLLSSSALDVERFQRRDGEILLVKDLLDHQVIDVRGSRVVRVNDVDISK